MNLLSEGESAARPAPGERLLPDGRLGRPQPRRVVRCEPRSYCPTPAGSIPGRYARSFPVQSPSFLERQLYPRFRVRPQPGLSLCPLSWVYLVFRILPGSSHNVKHNCRIRPPSRPRQSGSGHKYMAIKHLQIGRAVGAIGKRNSPGEWLPGLPGMSCAEPSAAKLFRRMAQRGLCRYCDGAGRVKKISSIMRRPVPPACGLSRSPTPRYIFLTLEGSTPAKSLNGILQTVHLGMFTAAGSG